MGAGRIRRSCQMKRMSLRNQLYIRSHNLFVTRSAAQDARLAKALAEHNADAMARAQA